MSQNNIIELLSVTSNAVKALDKTISSKSSGSGRGTPRNEDAGKGPQSARSSHSNRSSGDSGVGTKKTATPSVTVAKSGDNDAAEDSDHITTADEVLIRSTSEDPEHRTPSLNSSATSHDSRSRGVSNFNVADAKKMKVSKHLREIISPRDLAEFSQGKKGSEFEEPKQVSDAPFNRNVNYPCVADLNSNNNNRDIWREDFRDRIGKENRGNVINSFADKVIPGVPKKPSNGNLACFPLPKKTKDLFLESSDQVPSPAVYTVERHHNYHKQVDTKLFPPASKQENRKTKDDSKFPDARPSYEGLKQTDDLKETVTQTFPADTEDQQEGLEEDEMESVTSSQPEIFTVQERVVNISSQAFLASEDDDSISLDSAVLSVSQASKPQSYPLAKHVGPGLRQGALYQGSGVSQAGKGDEVHISKFSLTDRQRELRDALAKRGSQAKPLKRVVHAKMVDSHASSVSDEGNKNNNMDEEGRRAVGTSVTNMDSITAAVAASAAVAATQPFLKLQQDLETKMQTLLAEMDRVQKGASGEKEVSGGPVTKSDSDGRRLEYLEQQVSELTERRLQHLEMLQHQQMEMQAHLLSVSQRVSHQHIPHTICSPVNANRAAGAASSRQLPYSWPFIEHQLSQGRVLEEQAWVNQPVEGHQVEAQGLKSSLLDTPAPRKRPPVPVEYGGSKGGLLHEILATESSPHLNTTFSMPHSQTPPTKQSQSRHGGAESPVERARKLVQDLSSLEDQTAGSIWHKSKKTTRARYPSDEPAPIEPYLKRVRDSNTTPYSKLTKSKREENSKSSTASSRDAPVSNKFDDAHRVLQSVVTERQTLEDNLELLLRSRRDVDIYTLLDAASSDGTEMSHIQKLVEKRISVLQDEVKREVEWDRQHNATQKTQPSTSYSWKPTRGMGGKPGVGFGSGTSRMKINSGLSRAQTLSNTVTAPSKKKPLKPRPAPKKFKIPYNDEEKMTQIYGKAQYQKGRTTMRDPYLHYQNQAKSRTARVPSPKRAEGVINMKSSKTQTGARAGEEMYDGGAVTGGPRRFYFTPSTGYVPLASAAPAPVAGQLIPMAIPLGKPRMDPGLITGHETLPHSISPSSSTPIRPVVTAATNVAMVAMTSDGGGQMESVPELGKQVLPPVDIDSITPTSSPRGSDVHINQPDSSRAAGYIQTFYHQESEGEEGEADKTLTEDASDEQQQGTGISIPGYHLPKATREAVCSSSPFRASHNPTLQGGKTHLREEGSVPWEERCDELAEDLRNRDILQNRAKYWLEQELMAQLLTQMYPMFTAKAEQTQDHAEMDKSESIPDDESLLVGDTIGGEGLQLFVDAGRPVDNQLVNTLVREVIAEKVGGMLGRWKERNTEFVGKTSGVTAATTSKSNAGGIETEPEFVRPSRQPDHVSTPQPTPRTSPIPGFVSQHAAPATPTLTPPLSPKEIPKQEEVKEVVAPVAVASTVEAQPTLQDPQAIVESDTELSASVDISEELRALDERRGAAYKSPAFVTQSQHDIVTPTATPPPSPPTQPEQQPRGGTPTPSPPPLQPVTEPVQPALSALAPASPKKEEVQAKSPQPWGNPDSPIPEMNPDYEESEDVQHMQPKPLMLSVGVGPETQRSPSPQRQRTLSTDHSDLESESSPSSASDTNNDNISEGQWLVSRSEGQVAGLPLDKGVHQLAMEAVRKVDISTASTLRDTEDLELDDTDVSRSEGEFRHKADRNPETDPVLALMLQMQRQPGGFRQYDLPADHVQHLLSSTGKSVGEVNLAQGQGSLIRKSMGEMSEGQVLPSSHVTMVTPKAEQVSESQVYQSQRRTAPENRMRSRSPSDYRSTPNRPRNKSPPAPAGSYRHQQQYQPVSSGLPPTNTQSRRPLKSALVRTSSEEFRHSRDSDPASDRRGPATEYGTQTLTPDQLNTDAVLQSGTYLSMNRTASTSRQGSVKKSVEFDLSGTYEMSHRDSWYGSDDYSQGSTDRLSSSGRSLGLRYSLEDTGSDRHTQSSDRSYLRMSVTIPTTDAVDMDSDVSEIDISESTGK